MTDARESFQWSGTQTRSGKRRRPNGWRFSCKSRCPPQAGSWRAGCRRRRDTHPTILHRPRRGAEGACQPA